MAKKTTLKTDIAIKDSSGTEIGFLLNRKPDGSPIYEELTSPAIGTQQVDGSPEYSDFRAEEELRLVGSDMRGGFGLAYTGYPNDLKRYHTGVNIDGRFRNEVRAGPLATSSKKTPTATSTENVDNSGGVAWSNTGNANDDDDTTSASVTLSGQISDYLVINYAAHTATELRYLMSESGGSSNAPTFWAYYSSAWNSLGTGTIDNTWRTIAIGSSQTVTAIRVAINTASTATVNVKELTTDGVVSSLGPVTAMADFNSQRYAIGGANLWRFDSTDDRWYLIKTFAANPTDLLAGTVSGTDYLFICLGWSTAYQYMVAAETFTASNVNIKFMTEIAGTFYGSDTNNTVVQTTNPASATPTWATSKTYGEDAYNIVDIRDFDGLLYVKKTDCQVFYKDSSAVVQVLVSGKANIGGTNTARMFVWRESELIIPYGEQDLLDYDGTTITYISPALYCTQAPDFAGQVQAVTGDTQYLYIVMDDGADVQILAGREEVVDGTSDWRWHPIKTLTITGCASASISSIYKKRMYIGSTTAAEALNYIPITTKYGDIDNDSDYKYQTGGELVTPFLHCDLRGDKKAWPKLVLTQGHTYDANIYWEVHYKKLGDSDWVDIGDFKGSATTRITEKFLPNDGSANEPQSEMMRFKFVPITNDTAKTPIMLSFDIQAIWYPTQRDLIHCQIICADDEITKIGTKDVIRAETKKALLDELYNPAKAWPRAFYKPSYEAAADLIYIKALPPKRATIHRWEKGVAENRIEYLFDCLFEVVPLS